MFAVFLPLFRASGGRLGDFLLKRSMRRHVTYKRHVYFVYGKCNEKPYTWKESRIVVLHLSKVSSCSVLINLRNNVLNFAVFTTVFEFKIGFSGVNKHSLLPWQLFSYDLNHGHFRTSPAHANFSGRSKFFISHFV